MKQEIDYIEYFMANEKKQKRLTFIVAALFTVFAIVLIVLMLKIQSKNRLISSQEVIISKLELRHKVDSIKNLVKEVEVTKQNVSTLEREIPKESGSVVQKASTPYTVYIQYMPDYKSASDEIRNVLVNAKYTTPSPENMKTQKFGSSIRYFKPEAQEEAEKIARLCEQATQRPFAVQYVALKVSKKQIEVWIGEDKK